MMSRLSVVMTSLSELLLPSGKTMMNTKSFGKAKANTTMGRQNSNLGYMDTVWSWFHESRGFSNRTGQSCASCIGA